MLRWEKQSGYGEAWFAYSGDLRIAMVVQVSLKIDPAGRWTYSVDGVNTKWTTKGRGDVKSAESGKRAVERAWATWLDRAGLQPKPLT